MDFDIPEIFEEGFNNAFKKVQRRNNKSKKENEKVSSQKRSPENTTAFNSGGHLESPRSSQQINFCIDNQQSSKNIPQVKPRISIPEDSEEFENKNLNNSQVLKSKKRSEELDFAQNIEFNDQSILKCNSLNFSSQSEI